MKSRASRKQHCKNKKASAETWVVLSFEKSVNFSIIRKNETGQRFFFKLPLRDVPVICHKHYFSQHLNLSFQLNYFSNHYIKQGNQSITKIYLNAHLKYNSFLLVFRLCLLLHSLQLQTLARQLLGRVKFFKWALYLLN